jgi:hypothetical protein
VGSVIGDFDGIPEGVGNVDGIDASARTDVGSAVGAEEAMMGDFDFDFDGDAVAAAADGPFVGKDAGFAIIVGPEVGGTTTSKVVSPKLTIASTPSSRSKHFVRPVSGSTRPVLVLSSSFQTSLNAYPRGADGMKT